MCAANKECTMNKIKYGLPALLLTATTTAGVISLNNDIKEKTLEKVISNPIKNTSDTTNALGLLTAAELLGCCEVLKRREENIKKRQENIETYNTLKKEIENSENSVRMKDGSIYVVKPWLYASVYPDFDQELKRDYLLYKLSPDGTIYEYMAPTVRPGAFASCCYTVDTRKEIYENGEVAIHTTETTKYGTKREYINGKLVSATYPDKAPIKVDTSKRHLTNEEKEEIMKNKEIKKLATMCYGETGEALVIYPIKINIIDNVIMICSKYGVDCCLHQPISSVNAETIMEELKSKNEKINTIAGHNQDVSERFEKYCNE